MSELAERFAAALAERLALVLPSSFSAVARYGVIEMRSELVSWTAYGIVDWFVDEPDPLPDRFERAAWNVLNTAQDFVSEVTREPWPRALGAVRSEMAPPAAVVENRILKCWYGESVSPIVELPAIALDDLAPWDGS
jgi:hypothetical protein